MGTMNSIPDFTDTEAWVVKTTIKERFGEAVPVEVATSELRLDPADRQLTLCPTLFWNVGDTSFVALKIADQRFRCQFYHRLYQQFNTSKDEYDDLAECVTALLQTHQEHERQRQEATDTDKQINR